MWLTGDAQWRQACDQEAALYLQMGELVQQVSDAREQGKATLVAALAEHHGRVLALDHHPITLASSTASSTPPTSWYSRPSGARAPAAKTWNSTSLAIRYRKPLRCALM